MSEDKTYSQEIIDKLDETNPQLRSSDILDILDVCNQYIEKEKRQIKIQAVKSYCRLVSDYLTAIDTKSEKAKQIEKKLRLTVKQVL